MNRITTQSLFSSTSATRSWQSYLTSTVVHAGIIALLLLITFPVVREVEKPAVRTTLIAPVLPPKIAPYKVKAIKPPVIQRPLVAKITPPKLVAHPVIKPPEIKQQQPEVKPQIVAEMPKPLPPAPVVRPAPAVKFDSPIAANNPAPKPAQIHTGVFGGTEQAKGPTMPNQVKVGGFGDPHGVNPQANAQPSTMTMAKLGGFDLPNGDNRGGANGSGQSGSVRPSGFGNAGAGSGGAGIGRQGGSIKTGGFGDGSGGTGSGNGRPGGSVKTGGFGDSAPAAGQGNELQRAHAAPPATPVEIVFKPKPLYTPEARSLKLEGQVKLEVIFLASGNVRVVRVVQGLGHGLDQAAEQAAAQVRFHPATRDGTPIDTNATIYISFELT